MTVIYQLETSKENLRSSLRAKGFFLLPQSIHNRKKLELVFTHNIVDGAEEI